MASARITFALPPNIDVTSAPLAFGEVGIPKLNDELQDNCLITRQRALMTLSRLVHDPEKIYEAIRAGCIESLKYLLVDKDNTVRYKTTEILHTTASHNLGRNAILEFDVILPVANLFDDDIEVIRMNAHQSISMLSTIKEGAEGIVEADLIPSLVFKLSKEGFEIKDVILNTLHFCARASPLTCLGANIMPVLKSLLTHKQERIRSGSARVLMDVCVPLPGKNAACEDPLIVPLLVGMLEDVDEEARASAAGALMTIAITTKGKYASLKAHAIPPLLELIHSRKTEVRLYAIKTLTMLAESPEGRNTLWEQKKLFEYRVGDAESAAVSRAAEIALKVINWKP